ncbi:MAG: hypothetical protein COW13_05670 [Candidatus Omnitrophica bacterium CG12_big_fil_rev_8_21_14_0_65_50_5]|nr:MAG: hypothetical protein COW13_05670 [Candidatus Omnitrophica bacterium CG12_big_fil_rev_8_21_14_0_65_50_5]
MHDLLSQKQLFDSYLKHQAGVQSSAFSFVNIFAWADFFRFEFKIIGGCLCVFAHQDIGCFQYLPPLGKDVTAEVIDECFRYMKDINRGSGLSRVEHVPQEMRALFDVKLYRSEARAPEYVYDRREIENMKGLALASQRWLWNHFTKHHVYTFEPYCADDLQECRDLYERWAQNRLVRHTDETYQEMMRENRVVHRRVLEAFRDLDVIVRVVKINGQIAGYTAGYPVSQNTFCDLFEITDLSFKGLPTAMFRRLCADADVARYDFINAMDDFGLPDVQRTKMSFKPRFLLPSYTVSLR